MTSTRPPSGRGGMALPAVPALPHTFRPRRGRWAAIAGAAAFFTVMVVVALAIPAEGPVRFSTVDRVLSLGVGLLVALVLSTLARLKVDADDRGLRVVNLLRSRRLEWAEVVTVRLSRDDPWAMLDLSDGTSLPAMAIQAADGERARTAALQLALLVETRSGLEGDPR